MKKILFLILCFFVSIKVVNATTISSIDMDIVLDKYGNATITETWAASVGEGTEGWHPYYNLADSEIKMISAYMDDVEYSIPGYWDEGASLSEKAYKAGLYRVNDDELDVVFGISNYGSHIYRFTYQITNFVKETTDAQILYWQLFPYNFSAKPGRVDIKVTGLTPFSNTLDVWGYGKYGALCYVDNGAIYMSTDGERVDTDEYLTLLAKFDLGTFETESKLDSDFNHYYEMAQDGAEVYKEKENKTSWFASMFTVITNIIFWCVVIAGLSRVSNKKKINYDFGEAGKTLPKDRDINYFRDIPCNKDIYRAFWVSSVYDLNKSDNDFLGAILLKWICEGTVTVQTNTSKKLFKEKKEDVIIFNTEPDANENEVNLYRYMLEASKDGILEKNEFKDWCKNHYSKVLNWSDKVLDYERGELIKDGNITDVLVEKGLAFKYKVHSYVVNPHMKEEAIQMKGLKKFLTKFSQIKEKQPIEVKLWDQYLMYAQIFGIADKVMERFKDLYPEVMQEMENYNFDYNTFMFVHTVSSSGVNAASAARQAAQSYSSGGGGFSSGGGGGGSFGGGGGGGGFR